jgi:hypothetical protein
MTTDQIREPSESYADKIIFYFDIYEIQLGLKVMIVCQINISL